VESVGDVVYVHAPAVHGAVPVCVAAPVIDTVTVAASPAVAPLAEARRATLMHEEGIEDNIYHPPVTPVWQDAWRVTEGIITMMAHETAAHHVPLLVVTLANPPQIYPSAVVRRYYMQSYGSNDIFYPDERIKALSEREGFEVLNLAAPMQAYADEHHAFLVGFKDTKMGVGHWNAEGHRLAGTLIAEKICAMLSAGARTEAKR